MRGKPNTPKARMSAAQYQAHLETIGMTPAEFARYIGASGRAGEKWAAEGPTQVVALIVCIMASGRAGAKHVATARVRSGLAHGSA